MPRRPHLSRDAPSSPSSRSAPTRVQGPVGLDGHANICSIAAKDGLPTWNQKPMRWDGQRVENQKGLTLPGMEVERVRTFDAPEALGINFHEVRAKSALNKVPGTYLPFNWTVNAFRGCAHAC